MLQVVGCCDQTGGNCLTDAHVALAVRCLSPLEAMTAGGFAPPDPLVRISRYT